MNTDVKATVPSTLGLTLTPVNFGAFVPGVANQYTGYRHRDRDVDVAERIADRA